MMSLQEIRDLVKESTGSPHSSFYRRLYRIPDNVPCLDITSWDEWRALPALTKDDLARVPLKERTFVPWNALETLSATSGTSGKPPVFLPRCYLGALVEHLLAPGTAGGALLSGILQYQHEHERALEELGMDVHVVQLDVQNIAGSVLMAEKLGARTIMGYAYAVSALCPHVTHTRFAESVSVIAVAGERWSRSEFRAVQSVFPNAAIRYSYGTRESGTQAISDVLDTSHRPVFRSIDAVHHEFIDKSGKPLELSPGAEGEILITTRAGAPSGFPFLRQRVGDVVRIVDAQPDGSCTFELLGRAELEFIKMPGGMLRIDEIVRVVEGLGMLESDEFEAHCFEEDGGRMPRKRIVMHLALRTIDDAQRVAHAIARELHLGPSFTYADGVREGTYLPLTCMSLEERRAGGKRKRIVKHW
jgi:phenylacetate-coenzyme A ligase PaaK-like adenylate-forming protein